MSEYKKHTWVDEEVIDAPKLNNIETGISEAKKEAETSDLNAKKAQETADKHASRHAADGADPITPDMIGATPAGYGLGKLTNYEVYSDSEIDAVLIDIINSMGDHVFKRLVLSFKNTTNFTNAGGHYYTDIYKLSTNYAMITIKSYIVGGREMQRTWYEGILNPWEWVNPLMVLGVEYRTTKRHNGKAVYAKAFSIGALPNNTAAGFSISGATEIVTAYGHGKDPSNGFEYPFPIFGYNDGKLAAMISHRNSGNNVYIRTFVDYSSYSGVLTVEYTKD